MSPEVIKLIHNASEKFKSLGASVEEVSLMDPIRHWHTQLLLARGST